MGIYPNQGKKTSNEVSPGKQSNHKSKESNYPFSSQMSDETGVLSPFYITTRGCSSQFP